MPRQAELTIPTIGLIAATRGMLGAGIGLLVGGRLSPEARRAAGWTLVAVGALTTIPLMLQVIGAQKGAEAAGPSHAPQSSWEEREAERTAAAA